MEGDGAPDGARAPALGDGLVADQAQMLEQMRAIFRAVQAVLSDSARDANLNQSDFQALVRLVAHDGLTGGEVGRILGVSSSSVTELADRLERAGMVVRRRDPNDRRVVLLQPTRHGREVVSRALGPSLSAMHGLLVELAVEDRAAVGRFLTRVERALVAVALAQQS